MASRRERFIAARKAAGYTQESLAATLSVDRTTTARWESGKTAPLPYLRPKLSRLLGLSPTELAELLATGGSEDHRVGRDHAGGHSSHELVLRSARGTARLRTVDQVLGLGAPALPDLQLELRRVATEYALDPDLRLTLTRLTFLRDSLQASATRRRPHAADLRELYLLIAGTLILLASVSHDLGEPAAGMFQADAAEMFAEMSGHRGLILWVQCTKAMISVWRERPMDALRHAEKARSYGLCGIASVRLAGLEARALAETGRAVDALRTLRIADDLRAGLDESDDLSALGEVFTFPVRRQHYYSAATMVHLRDWSAVEHEASKVAQFHEVAGAAPHWPVTRSLSQIYLAHARANLGDMDGAWRALQPVVSLPDRERIPQLTHALGRMDRQLRQRERAGLPGLADLQGAIRAFRSVRGQ